MANGLSFDHVKPGPSSRSTAASHESWNTSFGTGSAARPVSIRISSESGTALKSPHSTGGYVRNGDSCTNLAMAATCFWRTWLWSNRQFRCVEKTCTVPRGPVDVGPDDGAQLVGIRRRGQRHGVVARDRPPRQHGIAHQDPVEVEPAGVHVVVARARPPARRPGSASPSSHTSCRANDVGVDGRQRRRDRAGAVPPTARTATTGSSS